MAHEEKLKLLLLFDALKEIRTYRTHSLGRSECYVKGTPFIGCNTDVMDRKRERERERERERDSDPVGELVP